MVNCPECKQKLRLPPTMLVDAKVICPKCGNHLRVVSRDPVRLEVLGPGSTLNKNAKPESYA